MNDDIFKAGVRPGGLTSHNEIKMLLCYILSSIEQPMSFSLLHEALQENGLVNYFELVGAMEGLVKSGHLQLEMEDGAERYRVTELGRRAGSEFEGALPLAVRERAVDAARRLMRRSRREQAVNIEVHPQNGGYRMELSIPEDGGSLVAFALHLPTKEDCELVRRRFLNDPTFIYKGVLALLTGNREVLGQIFPQEEGLF